MIHIWDTKIHQLTGEQIRRTYVYLPESYQTEENSRYPVLYMFDGHNLFFDSHATYGKSWGLKAFMDQTKIPLIIVATECNHNPDHGRLREYSPYSFPVPEVGYIQGKGDIYMDWMVNELKPAIDAHYRTLPDREHTMIAGSSMGGLMSLFAITHYNHIFSKAACLSPSLWFNASGLFRMIQRSNMTPDTVIYLDYGSKEMENHMLMRTHFAKVIYELIHQGVNVQSRVIPNGEHSESSWEQQIPFFMETLLYDMIPYPIRKIVNSLEESMNSPALSKENGPQNFLNQEDFTPNDSYSEEKTEKTLQEEIPETTVLSGKDPEVDNIDVFEFKIYD